MKKKSLFILLFFATHFIYSQEFKFGPVLGTNYYSIQPTRKIINKEYFDINYNNFRPGINFGGFIEYQLNKRFGVKSNLVLNSIQSELDWEETYAIGNNYSTTVLSEKLRLNTLQLHGLIKFDVSRSYNKGFYLLAGTRINYVLNAKETEGSKDNVSDLFKKTNTALLGGFGVTFLKHFNAEVMMENGISNPINFDYKIKTVCAYLLINANINSLLKR